MESNILCQTFSCFRGHQTIPQIAKQCKKQVKTNIFKAANLKVSDIILRFQILQKKQIRQIQRFYDSNSESHRKQWTEDQKRVFLSFLIAFCQLYSKKSSEITETEWGEISEAFGNKDILAMKYEGRVLERSVDRVRWKPEEETLLQNCIENSQNIKWSYISKDLFIHSQGKCYKTPKQCSQKWANYLNEKVQEGNWDLQQDIIITQTVLDYGYKWSKIAHLLSNKRTQHMIKNRYFSILKSFKKQNQHKYQHKLITQRKIMTKILNQLYWEKENRLLNLNSSNDSPQNQKQYCKRQIKQQEQIIYKQFQPYASDLHFNPLIKSDEILCYFSKK